MKKLHVRQTVELTKDGDELQVVEVMPEHAELADRSEYIIYWRMGAIT